MLCALKQCDNDRRWLPVTASASDESMACQVVKIAEVAEVQNGIQLRSMQRGRTQLLSYPVPRTWLDIAHVARSRWYTCGTLKGNAHQLLPWMLQRLKRSENDVARGLACTPQ